MRARLSVFAGLVVVFGLLPTSVLAQARDVVAQRRLVGALRSENSELSLMEIEALRQSGARRLEAERLRPILRCVEAELREEALAHVVADVGALEDDAQANALRGPAEGLSHAVIDASDAYRRCLEQGATSLSAIRQSRPSYRARLATLEALQPRTSALAQSLHQSGDRLNQPRQGGALTGELLSSLRALAHAAAVDGPHGFEVARAYVSALRLPAQPVYWRARTSAPTLLTLGLAEGVLVVSLLGSITILGPEGPPVPLLVSTGYGLFLSSAVASLAGYTWEQPSLPLFLTATALTLGTGALGIYARVRGDRRRRYLGRGLMVGTGLGLFWLVGGLVHVTHDQRVERRWRRYLELPVQFAPMVDASTAGLVATGRF